MTKTTKDERLVIRMDADLRAWIKAEAEAIGIDDAAFARMVLLERKRGESQSVTPRHIPQAPQEIDGDFHAEPDDGVPLDVNTIVGQSLDEAERSGATRRVHRQDFAAEEAHAPVVRGLHQVERKPGKQWANRYAT